jgi:hypothetical protein
MKKAFLVAYDYGQGAVWAIVNAESAAQISHEFPELAIVETRPAWMSDAQFAKIQEAHTYDLDEDRQIGLLAEILDARRP